MRKLLFLAVVSNFSTYCGQAQVCSKGPHDLLRFGPLCEYLCHCGAYQCDRETGECPQNVECDTGWMGSGCQYANIAYGATASSNHLLNTQNIVDGKGSTCPSWNQKSIDSVYVTIDFGREIKITEIHLVFSDSATVRPFRISVVGNDTMSVCSSVSNLNRKHTLVVKCDSPLYGQYVNITSEGQDAKLQVCEIKFPTGRNMAYEKPAYQSSLFEAWYPSQAVDGNTRSTSLSGTTCTHTLGTRDPWWILDLQAPIRILWFRIFNRMDDPIYDLLNKGMRNFRISLSEDNITFQEYYQDKSQYTPLVISHVLKPEVNARFVKIDLQGNDRIVTLCEVQVFGDCDKGRYGNCTQNCDYCPGKSCDKLTGFCQECQRGYFGNTCNESCDYCYQGDCSHDTGKCSICPKGKQGDKCEYDCKDFYFGMNCFSRCGNCLNGEVCDKVTGNCPRGCQDGWQEDNCDRECDDRFYGNCSTSCGKCATEKPCNKVSGLCENGACMDGWQTKKCDIPCDDHFYGNCSTECGACRDAAVCDKVNGSCPFGLCSEGWNGERCDTSPAEHQASNNLIEPSILGGSIVAAVAIIGIIISIVIIIIVKRRNMAPTMKQTHTNQMESISNNINSSAGIVDTSAKQTAETNLDTSKTYYNIEESSAENSLNTDNGISPRNYYEKLGDRMVTEEASYSTIEHSQIDTHGRKTSEITGDYDE
ncbi:hypothetical protein CHS0354_027125 [Potamilus streckersoni]|uniref:Fucolectin tachylectin-4 pentraxin-1 domain-containing protein n=1 Tax=Potamilus streckersoni TaxID=2493646 RepID=A0AAE0SHS2_9BIVA|nr:hypothetical protein CHS0354_027125 [Potamilus streckersoni]